MDINSLARLLAGTFLVAGGACIWAFTGTGEAGTAMIGAGAAMLPGAVTQARASAG